VDSELRTTLFVKEVPDKFVPASDDTRIGEFAEWLQPTDNRPNIVLDITLRYAISISHIAI